MTSRLAIGLFGTALAVCALAGCGSEEQPAPAAPPAAPTPPSAPAAPAAPADLPNGLVLSLAQFVMKDGKSVPGPARLEFLYRSGGAWRTSALEDPQSNVFHKAMLYPAEDGPRLLTLGGTAAIVKLWKKAGNALEPTAIWQKDFGGKFSRMRDAEIGDLYGEGKRDIAVATHDQGVVAVLRPGANGFTAVELDRAPDTFVHEIEIGDLDRDGKPEVYATPSEPNRLEAGASQAGNVVRYVPAAGKGREVVGDLGGRHAKEILVGDVDGDGTDELYVSVEGHVNQAKELVQRVEIWRYDADTLSSPGAVIAEIEDRLSRFLTAGDVDGDGKRELVAAAFSSGLWLLRPGADPRGSWKVESIDRDSAGFEHASILADLDGDRTDELYVASDKHKQVRRYVWDGQKLAREIIYTGPPDRPIFTWNLMLIPRELIPEG